MNYLFVYQFFYFTRLRWFEIIKEIFENNYFTDIVNLYFLNENSLITIPRWLLPTQPFDN